MQRKPLVAAIIGAGLLIAGALILKYLTSLGYIDSELSKRLTQVSIGIMLVVTGNYIPKTLEPLSAGCCEPSKKQSLQRFAGWAFVVAGLAYAIIWLVAPFELASVLSMSVVATCVLLVAVPQMWLLITRKRRLPLDKVN